MSTRHERKEAQRIRWQHDAEERERFEREHPVLSGKVKVEQYHEPPWRYVRPEPLRNGLEVRL